MDLHIASVQGHHEFKLYFPQINHNQDSQFINNPVRETAKEVHKKERRYNSGFPCYTLIGYRTGITYFYP